MSATLFLLPTFVALGAVGTAYALAKRVGAIVPFVFILAYVLTVGAKPGRAWVGKSQE